jgi:hypothetical protein
MKQPDEIYHGIEDDEEVEAGYIIKAVITLVAIAACFTILLCVFEPFKGMAP